MNRKYMPKIYVLDTNVILFDSDCIFKFHEHLVCIPIQVIEEVDHFKKNQDEKGRNARVFARHMDNLRTLGTLTNSVPLNEEGGRLQVTIDYDALTGLDMSVVDNRILAAAVNYKSRDVQVTLITKDVNLRIKADAFGIKASDYENSKVEVEGLYTGTGHTIISEAALVTAYRDGYLEQEFVPDIIQPMPNQCFVLHNEFNEKQAVLTRYNACRKEYQVLPEDLKTLGLVPRNSEQRFALDMLLDPEVSLVSLIGMAGTGKTLCAIAAGLFSVMEAKIYKKVMLLKPVIAAGNSNQLGFLPGTLEEKLSPWLASYFDNIDYIMGIEPAEEKIPRKKGSKIKSYDFSSDDKGGAKISAAQELIAHNYLEIGSLEHIRGRSLPHQYIILDEVQNVTPAMIKTVITRAGEGTKIVLLGDIAQIDAPYLDSSSNGLTYVADRFKAETISGHVTLTRSERSKLAERAAELL